MKFYDNKLVRLRENSELLIPGVEQEKPLSLLGGVLHLFSRDTNKIRRVTTPEVSAAIRGTEFVIESTNGETEISVLSGAVQVSNSAGDVRVGRGERALTKRGEAPRKELLIRPKDKVQWAMTFPTLLTDHPFSSVSFKDAEWKDLLHGVLPSRMKAGSDEERTTAAMQPLILGRYGEAEKEIQQLPAGPEREYLQAVLEINTGDTERAAERLSSLAHSPDAALRDAAVAQLGLLAVLSGDQKNTETLAALLSDADGPIQSLFLSYRAQERGALEEALEAINAAAALETNPTLLARKGELLLGLGRHRDAYDVLHKAYLLLPSDPYVVSTLGFAYLTLYELEKAERTFLSALSEDHGYATAHFGLGLTRIQQGSLAAGREELEKAAALQPARSLYRSYLGKAFFEEEREELAGEEYELAISLDQQDPTPLLYRSFLHLSRNRPVHALKDIERSIELNDARMVYRSRSLLDKDIAVRSTSLAEVYRQLGFGEVSRIEAIKSLQQDYSNYSAHRLLADSLEGAFFADARFTENIIAELLAPVSFNTFDNVEGFSTDASFNDYAALFNRPEHRTNIGALATNIDDLYEAAVEQTGSTGQFGYLAGYETSYGRGEKSGGDYLRFHDFNLATQYQIDVDNRVVLRTGYTRFEDVYEEEGFSQDDFEVSLGSHHKLSPSSTVLTRFELFDRSLDTFEDDIVEELGQAFIFMGERSPLEDATLFFNQRTDEDVLNLRGNLQYIFDHEWVDVVAGAQYLNSDEEAFEDSSGTKEIADLTDDFPFARVTSADTSLDSYSAYTYATFHPLEQFDFQLGLSYTGIELPQYDVLAPFVDGKRDDEKLSPKAGFTIYPSEDTTIRGAYFQTLGASTVSDIGTLEPTLVGSFNQVYGDLPGAETENYGIGIDHKVPKKLYAGAEYIYRDIERDGVFITQSETLNFDTLFETISTEIDVVGEAEREHLIRGYLYGVLSESFTATLDYLRDDLKTIDLEQDNETDRIAAQVNYFSPLRWYAFGRTSWYHQELKNDADLPDGSEDFWIVDLGAGYRIPDRHGIIQVTLLNVLDQSFRYSDRDRFVAPPEGIGFLFQGSVNF